MPPRSTQEIRDAYLQFFHERGHAIISGSSLVPDNDPTVLFTTAGMHPLVPYLMGEAHPAGKRLVDVQLCVRTQDIDEVGDDTHLTCFEMLGNWSLGDYFKEEAIEMSYTFLTQILAIDPSMLAVTCFAGDTDAPKDDESAKIWMSHGIPAERIGFLPKEKNWWGPAGQTGPCGPDTEMFYWIGEGKPQGNPATHDAQWMEVWNDVFMQYGKQEDGTFQPLSQRNVDTGMGLERIAAVMQNVSSVYETDALSAIVCVVERLSDQHTSIQKRAVRIVTDHMKAATFIGANGVKPSNADRGYILRRLIRRAIRSARMLGISHEQNICSEVAKEVVRQYGEAYPHLVTSMTEVMSVLEAEERQFAAALREGQKHFEKLVQGLEKGSKIDGKSVFHLYDTYGFPLEMTKEMALEQGLLIDEEGFKTAFAHHQGLSRLGGEKRFAGGLADGGSETIKLHTATHLLNAALRKVLGDHVFQRGSNITGQRLRFDFSHPEKMTAEQIRAAEEIVNDAIRADVPITYTVMTVDQAKASGAIGVFDQKYGEKVKVYDMGVWSKEICGGPHVARTGMLGTFAIQKEESSSSGVRRIKAVLSGGSDQIEVAKEA